MQKALSRISVQATDLKANLLPHGLLSQKHSAPVQIARLLASNDPPSEEEEILVKNAIQAMQDEIRDLQLELEVDSNDPHRRRRERAESRKAALVEDILAHESILSQIRRMPPELLQIIFLSILLPDIDPIPWPTSFTLPWPLGQVCRSWRTIVHSTPILWSRISLNFRGKRGHHRYQKTRLGFVLQRSLTANLRISIHGLNAKRGDARLSLLSTLAAHSERWEYFVAELNLDAILCLQSIKGRLPRLSELKLELILPRHQGSLQLHMFSIAPKLKEVALLNVDVTLSLPQLHSYQRNSTPPYVVDGQGSSLQPFSNLVRFVTSWNRVVRPSEPRITFHRLQDLVIFFDSHIAAVEFLKNITLPSIAYMLIWCRTPILPHISAMLSRTLPCHLRYLSINTSAVENDHGALTDLLLLTPELNGLEMTLPLLAYLSDPSVDPEIPVLIPALQSLTIRVESLPPDFTHVLLAPIVSRYERMAAMKPPCHTLRTLTIKFATRLECRLGYLQLQTLPPVGDLDGDVLARLSSWKFQLVDQIPQLSYRRTPYTMLLNPMNWSKLDRLFNRIEGYTIPKSGYLQVSALHFAMYALSTTESPELIPGETQYQFRRRAKALLDRWEPLLLKDLHYYHWINTSADTLTYVCKRSVIR